MRNQITTKYNEYCSVKSSYKNQKRQIDKTKRKFLSKIEQIAILLVHKLTNTDIDTLDKLTIAFNQEIQRLSFLYALTPNESNSLRSNDLNQALKQLSADFGPQSTVMPSERDIKDTDLKSDTALQNVLKAIKAGNYKVKNAHELEQLLSKIPVAFISAGKNPNDPQIKNTDQTKEHEELRKDLNNNGYIFVEVDGYYDKNEKSFMVILDQALRTLSFRDFLSTVPCSHLIALGRKYNQDSLLFRWGAAQFYYYPDQKDAKKDRIRYGEGFVIYDMEADKEHLPDNHYSQISQEQNSFPLRFQLYISFAHQFNLNLFDILCEYKRKTRFEDYYRCGQTISVTDKSNIQPSLVLMRGVGGINEAAMQLKADLKKQGISAIIVGSDAHIFDMNQPNSKFTLWDDIRVEMVQRNQQALDALLPNQDVKIIIYADMNKKLEYFQSYARDAIKNNRKVIAWQTSGSDVNFCYDARHWQEFDDKASSSIQLDNQTAIKQIIGKYKISNVITEICEQPLLHSTRLSAPR